MKRMRLAVRLDPVERETVDGLAKACGLPLAEYMRRCALHRKIRPLAQIPAVNAQTYVELGRVGSNVNQIAVALHKQQVTGDDAAGRIARALPRLYEIIQDIRRQLVTQNACDDEGVDK